MSTGAITFEEREASEYDDLAVKKEQEAQKAWALEMSYEEILMIKDDNE